MTPHDRELDRMFRELARSGPREAPPRVQASLEKAFRGRRRIRRAVVAACAGVAAGIAAAALIVAGASRQNVQPPPRPVMVHIAVPESPALAALPEPVRTAPVRRRTARPEPPRPAAFALLPGADTFAPLEYGEVVRMQLPRSVLRVVGLPVSQDRVSERIEADVLLGQDGLARAVRFIQ